MTDQELNEAVAVKLGWKVKYEYGAKIPDYCNSISAAWEILIWIRERPFSERMKFAKNVSEGTKVEGVKIDPFYWMLFNSTPRAICEAFLKLQ